MYVSLKILIYIHSFIVFVIFLNTCVALKAMLVDSEHSFGKVCAFAKLFARNNNKPTVMQLLINIFDGVYCERTQSRLILSLCIIQVILMHVTLLMLPTMLYSFFFFLSHFQLKTHLDIEII